MLQKFVRSWEDRHKSKNDYSQVSFTKPSVIGQDSAGVALSLSKRLIAVEKMKSILNIEAGMQMIALALAISSEVNNINMYNLLF